LSGSAWCKYASLEDAWRNPVDIGRRDVDIDWARATEAGKGRYSSCMCDETVDGGVVSLIFLDAPVEWAMEFVSGVIAVRGRVCSAAEDGEGGERGPNGPGSMSGIVGGTAVPVTEGWLDAGSGIEASPGVDITDHIGVAPEKSMPALEKSIETPRAV